jgi:hypothetical protein
MFRELKSSKIYALASALNIHIYQMQLENSSIDTTSQIRIQICLNELKRHSKVWIAAKIVYKRFETILGDKGFRGNSHGALELVKRRQSTEILMNGSDPS